MDRGDESWPGQSEEDNQVTAGRAKVSKVLQADKDVEDAGEEEEAEPPRASQGCSRGGKVLSTANTSMHVRTYARISAGARTCRCNYRNQRRKHM